MNTAQLKVEEKARNSLQQVENQRFLEIGADSNGQFQFIDTQKRCDCGCNEPLPRGVHGLTKYKPGHRAWMLYAEKLTKEYKRKTGEEKGYDKFLIRHPNVKPIVWAEAESFCEMKKEPRFGAIIEYKIRLILGIPVSNGHKKFFKRDFIREHPEYEHLFK